MYLSAGRSEDHAGKTFSIASAAVSWPQPLLCASGGGETAWLPLPEYNLDSPFSTKMVSMGNHSHFPTCRTHKTLKHKSSLQYRLLFSKNCCVNARDRLLRIHVIISLIIPFFFLHRLTQLRLLSCPAWTCTLTALTK